jgi:6-phosphogluconolactonase
MHPEILRTKNFVRDAVALIERAADTAIFERGHFRIGLSGGNTPRLVYEELAGKNDAWDNWVFTFGDERCVPPDDVQSNYRMVRETLFDGTPIPPRNVLRMRGEDDPARAAADYEAELREHAGHAPMYRHDVLLLGMGDDGHTASLFPGTPALDVSDRWVVSNFVPKFNAHRITLTYPVINAARHVVFLVKSSGKEEMLEKVFSGKWDFPCNRVRPVEGNLTWLLGED